MSAIRHRSADASTVDRAPHAASPRETTVLPGEIGAGDGAGRPSVDGARFRRVMRCLAASVCVVTTIDGEGVKLGLTATSVTSVSLEPPLVLVCVDSRSRTIAPLMAGAPFVIHILAQGQEELARRFATFVPDKFAGLDYQLTTGGCPRLEGVLASIEIRIPPTCVIHRHNQ